MRKSKDNRPNLTKQLRAEGPAEKTRGKSQHSGVTSAGSWDAGLSRGAEVCCSFFLAL